MSIAMCLVILGAHMNVFFIVKVKICNVIKIVTYVPSIILTIEANTYHILPTSSNLFSTQVFLVCALTSRPNHKPFKYSYLIEKYNHERPTYISNKCLMPTYGWHPSDLQDLGMCVNDEYCGWC